MPAKLLPSLRFTACSVLLSWADDRPQGTDRVIATVNGEDITAAQFDAVVRTRLEDMGKRVRQLRHTALNKLIDNLLLDQAARKAGTDTDGYLRRNVESVEVPPRK